MEINNENYCNYCNKHRYCYRIVNDYYCKADKACSRMNNNILYVKCIKCGCKSICDKHPDRLFYRIGNHCNPQNKSMVNFYNSFYSNSRQIKFTLSERYPNNFPSIDNSEYLQKHNITIHAYHMYYNCYPFNPIEIILSKNTKFPKLIKISDYWF